MAHETVSRTISSEVDERALLDNGHPPLARLFSIGDDWTSIRVGIRLSTTRATAWSTVPSFYFGVCSGLSNPAGTVSPNHFVGVTSIMDWTTIGDAFRLWSATSNARLVKFESGSAATATPSSAGTLYCGKSSVLRSVLYLDITKGSPNWTIKGYGGTYFTDQTLSVFKANMNASGAPPSPITLVINGTIAVDEATYGAMNAVNLAFLSGSDPFEISDVDYKKIS